MFRRLHVSGRRVVLQMLDGGIGSSLLRLLFAVAGALSDGLSIEQDPHGKGLVVVRSGGVHQLIGEHLTTFSLDQFLQVGFVIPAGLIDLVHVIQDKALNDVPVIVEPTVQKNCGQEGLHCVGQNGRTTASTAGIFTLAQLQVASQIQGLGHQYQAVFADQIGANAL